MILPLSSEHLHVYEHFFDSNLIIQNNVFTLFNQYPSGERETNRVKLDQFYILSTMLYILIMILIISSKQNLSNYINY